MKRSRRGATKSDDVIYLDSDVYEDEGGGGGNTGRAKAKDYNNNNRVEDDDKKAPSASVYGLMNAFAKKRETPQRGDDNDDGSGGAGNPKKRCG